MFLSLRNRIRLPVIGAVLLLAIFMYFFFPAKQQLLLRSSYEHEIQSITETVGLGIRIGLNSGDFGATQDAFEYAKEHPKVDFVVLIRDGEVFSSFPKGITLSQLDSSQDEIIVQRVAINTEAFEGEVVVGSSTKAINEAIRQIRLTGLIASLGALLLGILVSMWLVRSITVSLKNLNEAAGNIAEGKTQSIIKVSNDEVGQLADAFNSMASTVYRNMHTMKTIIELSLEISGEDSMEATYELLLKGTQNILATHHVTLHILDKDGDQTFFKGENSNGIVQSNIKRILADSNFQRRFRQSDDILRSSEMASFEYDSSAVKEILVVPIHYRNLPLGVLLFTDKQDGTPFDEHDEESISRLAKMVGILIYGKSIHFENQNAREYLQKETKQLVQVLDQLADGNFAVEIDELDRGDDISRVKKKLNEMIQQLRHLIRGVRQAVKSTSKAVDEISASSVTWVQASHEQSAQATKVASSIEQMSTIIVENANFAARTAETAERSGKTATESSLVVSQTVDKIRHIANVVQSFSETISQLSKSSEQIGAIVSVISEIATQTNLLALNAAVEAARAGEHGLGFSVVAEEVRMLAQRTSLATKEVAEMIKTIQRDSGEAVAAMQLSTAEAESSIELADKANQALQSMISSAEQTIQMITQIAAANEKQSANSKFISALVVNITETSQNSAQGAKRVAHSSDNLLQLTLELGKQMDRFQIQNSDAPVLE